MSSKAGIVAAAFSAHLGIPIKSEEEASEQDNEFGPPHIPFSVFLINYNIYYKFNLGTGFFGAPPVYYIRNEDLEPTKDFDFTKILPTTTTCERGGYNYERPFGWDRCALKVKGKYKNDIWLGEDGWREHSTPGEWAVSYHGTEMANIGSIADEGYKSSLSKRQKFGPGIYSTPSVKVAASYATEFTYENKKYKMVLQNRVNLSESNEIPASVNGTDAPYFVTANERNIRPYGVCFKSA